MASAHHQPSRLLSTSPMSTAAERYVQMRVCFESATAVADPSSRPARLSAKERNGMIATLSAVMTMPSVECSTSARPNRAITAETVT